MLDKKTNIIFMNYPEKRREPTKIKIGTWTEQQKNDFLANLNEHTPWDYNQRCVFNVLFDKSVIHARSFDRPKTFTPHVAKNRPNELIIQIIPDIDFCDCWAGSEMSCPVCLKCGDCTSAFIKKYIGEILFPNKYAKQK